MTNVEHTYYMPIRTGELLSSFWTSVPSKVGYRSSA